MKKRQKNKNFFMRLATILVLIAFCISATPNIKAETVDELNDQIEDAKAKLEELNKQAAVYQKNIRIKQEEAASLNNQVDILNNQIAKTELEIEATQEEIKKTELEIRNVELQVLEKEDLIDSQKNSLAEIIKDMKKHEDTNLLEIFVLNDTISDFFAQVENTKDLSANLDNSLDDLKLLKHDLLDQKDTLDDKRKELQNLSEQLELDKAELEGEISYKDDLLVKTKESEEVFYNLYWQSKQEQEDANNAIYALEKQMRAKLEELKGTDQELTDSTLMWPVPKNKITSTFHDPDYPFRYLFEHPAIDVRAAQGTTLRAAADGYVLTAKDAGMGYSYISIIHANGLSTVYGHVSAIYVKADEYVAKGEVIGLTGGMPGTPGAGNLCTGPHLHFEVRLNGIPVNPLSYLP